MLSYKWKLPDVKSNFVQKLYLLFKTPFSSFFLHYPLIHRVWNLKLKFSETVLKGHGNEVFCQKSENFNFFVKLSFRV